VRLKNHRFFPDRAEGGFEGKKNEKTACSELSRRLKNKNEKKNDLRKKKGCQNSLPSDRWEREGNQNTQRGEMQEKAVGRCFRIFRKRVFRENEGKERKGTESAFKEGGGTERKKEWKRTSSRI